VREEDQNRIANWKESAEVLAIEVEQRAKALADILIVEKDAMTAGLAHTVQGSRELGDKFAATLDMHIRERCLFLMLGLVGMRRSKGNKMYTTGFEFNSLQEQVTTQILGMAVATQRNAAIPLPINQEALSQAIAKDIQNVRRTITSYCVAMEGGASEPEGLCSTGSSRTPVFTSEESLTLLRLLKQILHRPRPIRLPIR
jgi:hypothetical protein